MISTEDKRYYQLEGSLDGEKWIPLVGSLITNYPPYIEEVPTQFENVQEAFAAKKELDKLKLDFKIRLVMVILTRTVTEIH